MLSALVLAAALLTAPTEDHLLGIGPVLCSEELTLYKSIYDRDRNGTPDAVGFGVIAKTGEPLPERLWLYFNDGENKPFQVQLDGKEVPFASIEPRHPCDVLGGIRT